jgi:lipopolysaccharide transport system ATP-binding protein
MSHVLEFRDVSKRYLLGSLQGSLREALPRYLWRLVGRKTGAPRPVLWALKGLSFGVGSGEAMGIVGPNGAGKTTVLRLASRVTQPTSGRVSVRGRASALIQLGAGFHPDLTGRENVYLNGTILGLKRREIQQRFDQIVAFSGLERFLDTPVKRYSSGMYARLGFAVAAHVNPDLLLVDEVLAVGDAAFQARCLKRMSQLKSGGTAIVLVTHNLGYLQRLCSRALFLHQGDVAAEGPVADVIQAYRDHPAYSHGLREGAPDGAGAGLVAEAASGSAGSESPIAIDDVSFSSASRMPVGEVRSGSELTIHVRYLARRPVAGASIEVWVYGMDGTEYASFATTWDGFALHELSGVGEVQLQLDPVCLMPGPYYVQVAIADRDGLAKYDMHWDRHKLLVRSGPVAHGLLFQPHRWSRSGSSRPDQLPTQEESGVDRAPT